MPLCLFSKDTNLIVSPRSVYVNIVTLYMDREQIILSMVIFTTMSSMEVGKLGSLKVLITVLNRVHIQQVQALLLEQTTPVWYIEKITNQ